MIGELVTWAIDVVYTLGYPGLVVLLVLENLFPPIPSELVLPLAGFLTGQGRLAFHWAVAAATAGSVLGALALYAIGYTLGEERLRELVKRHGRWLRLRESDLDRVRRWFDRHGGEAVLIGRLVPVVRSAISVPAGLEHMPLWKFVPYTALGSGLFNGALIGLGWVLGSQWELAQQYVQILGWAGLIAATGAGVWSLRGRLRQRRSGVSARTAGRQGEE